MLKRIFVSFIALSFIAAAGVVLSGCGQTPETSPDPTETVPTISSENDNEAPNLTLIDIAEAFARSEAFEIEQGDVPNYTDVNAIGGLGFRANGEEVLIFEFENSFSAQIHAGLDRHANGAFLIESECFYAVDFFMGIGAEINAEN